jgi:hypothetical protein
MNIPVGKGRKRTVWRTRLKFEVVVEVSFEMETKYSVFREKYCAKWICGIPIKWLEP